VADFGDESELGSHARKVVLTTTIRLRFDFGSTAIRRRYDHSTTTSRPGCCAGA